MEDRYLFRGFSEGQWYYGAYKKYLPYTPYCCGPRPREHEYKHLIISDGFSDWGLPRDLIVQEVESDSVGQCTTYKDKNNKLIFEGDLVKCINSYNNWVIGLVEFDKEFVSFVVKYLVEEYTYADKWDFLNRYNWEIIGNKIENADMI